jgi:hypothetical protein
LRPPPEGWTAAVQRASDGELVDLLKRSQIVMWQAVMLADFDAYLGNPRPGASRTAYKYESVAVPARRTSAADRVRPLGIALTLVATALLAANGLVLWRRS